MPMCPTLRTAGCEYMLIPPSLLLLALLCRITDYGCADNAEEFAYLSRYSPLHNVSPPDGGTCQYPAMILATGAPFASHRYHETATLAPGSWVVCIRCIPLPNMARSAALALYHSLDHVVLVY